MQKATSVTAMEYQGNEWARYSSEKVRQYAAENRVKLNTCHFGHVRGTVSGAVCPCRTGAGAGAERGACCCCLGWSSGAAAGGALPLLRGLGLWGCGGGALPPPPLWCGSASAPPSRHR